MLRFVEHTGRSTVQNLDEVGYAGSLLSESVFWTLLGRRWRQPVPLRASSPRRLRDRLGGRSAENARG